MVKNKSIASKAGFTGLLLSSAPKSPGCPEALMGSEWSRGLCCTCPGPLALSNPCNESDPHGDQCLCDCWPVHRAQLMRRARQAAQLLGNRASVPAPCTARGASLSRLPLPLLRAHNGSGDHSMLSTLVSIAIRSILLFQDDVQCGWAGSCAHRVNAQDDKARAATSGS